MASVSLVSSPPDPVLDKNMTDSELAGDERSSNIIQFLMRSICAVQCCWVLHACVDCSYLLTMNCRLSRPPPPSFFFHPPTIFIIIIFFFLHASLVQFKRVYSIYNRRRRDWSPSSWPFPCQRCSSRRPCCVREAAPCCCHLQEATPIFVLHCPLVARGRYLSDRVHGRVDLPGFCCSGQAIDLLQCKLVGLLWDFFFSSTCFCPKKKAGLIKK